MTKTFVYLSFHSNFEASGPNCFQSMFFVKYFCHQNLSPKAFLDHQRGHKNSPNNRASLKLDDVLVVSNRYIANSIKVASGIGNWQLGVGHLSIQNNVMICLSDHQTIAS